jgi:hypothetical protein
MENPSQTKVMHEALGGQLEEFMDEYLIIGIKAGRNQRMILSCVTPNQGMDEILNECLSWANGEKDMEEPS